ncbi:MAG: response regulator transcription factor, partial [Mameliella sp.]|nr:response regulator transcription factor [Mameliella sp.]
MKVLIIEDDQFHATYLQEALAEALPEVTEIFHAADGVAGEEEARQGEIEAIVMDLQMEHRNGIEAARTIW